MSVAEDQDSFRQSLGTSAKYPGCLVNHGTFDHILEGYTERLDKHEERLFSVEGKADMELWEYGLPLRPHEFVSFRFEGQNCSLRMQNHLLGLQLFANEDPQCRCIFVHADNSRSRLKVTRDMLMTALTYHQVMARFVDFLFSFGKQDHPKDFHFSGFYDEMHLSEDQRGLRLSGLGRSGLDFKMSYNLKSVESSSRQPQFPWSMRQLAVYHSFDIVTGKTLWVVIKGDTLIKRRIKAATENIKHPDLDMSTALQAFLVSLNIQLIILDWCREQWRWYISYLEELQEITTSRALTMSFDRPTMLSSKVAPPRASTLPQPGRVRRAFTNLKRAASAIERSPPISLQTKPQLIPPKSPPEFEPDLQNTASFSFSDLQKVQSYEDKAREILLVIGSNIRIVTAIQHHYKELMEHSEISPELRVGSSSKLRDFNKAVRGIVNDLETHQSRAEMLLSTLKNRKELLHGVLEYRSMEANKRFAENAEASTNEMRVMTEEMNALTHKTKQETVSMRIITLVTLFFLPGTFISTIMSTDILQYSKVPNSEEYQEDYSSAALKRYASVTLPLMALTFLTWWVLYWWVDRKQRMKALKDQLRTMNKGRVISVV